jgi:PKD repeat protein
MKLNPAHFIKTFFIFTFFLTSHSVFAQIEECGFEMTPEAQRYYDSVKDQLKIYEQQFLNDMLSNRTSTVLNSVPIKAHIVRTTSGTGGLSETELSDALALMNSIYVDAGIEFFLCDGINYIDSDNYYDFETNEEAAMTSVNNINGVINIYFTNSIESSSSGNNVCGYAYYPGGPETVLMANSCALNGSTLSHELGHFFGLPHTHGNSNTPGSTEELVDGSNCEFTGDNICDTPADPQLSGSNVNAGCEYIGNALDANNDFYQPDPLNIMSYSRKACRTVFSPQQYARINSIYQLSRSDLACPGFSVDFVADDTQNCLPNFTVNLTDTSIGAVDWAWDVDGDDIIDYTTQNVTHTYDALGEYDVALTISDGTTTLNKVKAGFIVVGAQNINTTTIQMNLTLDDWPVETTWQFSEADGNILYSGGPYVEGTDDFTTITETFVINPDLCYTFEINDAFGDGICCSSGFGNYQLTADDNSVLVLGGDFEFSAEHNFFNAALNTETFDTEDLQLYPNPSSSIIHIKSPSLPDSYVLYNSLGQVIKEYDITSDSDLNINVESLYNGLYFIKLIKGNLSQVLSFVKN